MATTTNPSSLLWQLRQLVPPRPLSVAEGYRVAELQANRLLASAGIDEPGTPSELVTSLPYVEVALRHDVPESGYLNWFKPRWLVLLNAREPLVRRRYSLMHEFKHLLDHPFRDFLYPASYFSDSHRRREQAAEYFAACVLMPKRLVVRRWAAGVQTESALAAEFVVSEVAMRRRLQELGLVERPPRCLYPTTPSRPTTKTEYFRGKSPRVSRDLAAVLSISPYATAEAGAKMRGLNGGMAA